MLDSCAINYKLVINNCIIILEFLNKINNCIIILEFLNKIINCNLKQKYFRIKYEHFN